MNKNHFLGRLEGWREEQKSGASEIFDNFDVNIEEISKKESISITEHLS